MLDSGPCDPIHTSTHTQEVVKRHKLMKNVPFFPHFPHGDVFLFIEDPSSFSCDLIAYFPVEILDFFFLLLGLKADEKIDSFYSLPCVHF